MKIKFVYIIIYIIYDSKNYGNTKLLHKLNELIKLAHKIKYIEYNAKSNESFKNRRKNNCLARKIKYIIHDT